jgi:carbamoyltransferase
MRNRVNMKIKKREGFRPFAPAVIAEDAAEYFELKRGEEPTYEHMLFVMPVRAKYRDKLLAITHFDGSARVQTVTKEGNPQFYAMLQAFGARTGVSMLLNTSFNVKGQPIVCTPEEAVDTFLFAQLDALVIGNYVLSRND